MLWTPQIVFEAKKCQVERYIYTLKRSIGLLSNDEELKITCECDNLLED